MTTQNENKALSKASPVRTVVITKSSAPSPPNQRQVYPKQRQGPVLLQHAVVERVAHVQIALRIQGHAPWDGQAVRAEAVVVGGLRRGVRLAEDAGGRGGSGQRAVVLQHAVVEGVGHVQVALRIQRHAIWAAQGVSGDAAVVWRSGGEAAALAKHAV